MKFSLPVVALVFLGEAAAAAVGPSEIKPRAFLSFEQWVEDIIADPNGVHLSPEEALESHIVLLNNTDIDLEARALEKRVGCMDQTTSLPAWAPDAVACINYLASIGSRACTVHTHATSVFRTCNRAHIWGQQGGHQDGRPKTDSCANVARTGGRIMDVCYRADNTVKGTELVTNQLYMVGINRPRGS